MSINEVANRSRLLAGPARERVLRMMAACETHWKADAETVRNRGAALLVTQELALIVEAFQPKRSA